MVCARCGRCKRCTGTFRTGSSLRAGAVALTLLALTASACGGTEDGSAAPAGAQASASPGNGPDEELGELGGVPQRITPSAPPSPSPSLGRPTPKPPASSPSPERTTTGPGYTAWAGPGCTGGGRYDEDGRYNAGHDGWYTVRSGGHRGDGCDGRFTAIPMSGSKTKDSGGRATWTWYVGSGYLTCSVAVVVPESARERDVAGKPSTYHVLRDPEDPGSAVKTFEIDQTSLRGRGVVIERVPVHARRLTVQLVDRGQDWGAGRDRAHHAAAQMRAECRA